MWLPDPQTERTIASATVRFPVYLQFARQRLCIVFGKPPYSIKTDKRITKRLLKQARSTRRKPSPLVEAIKYANLLKEPSIVSKSQIARKLGVSRARVCQMLNLLKLAPDIQEDILSGKRAGKVFTERRLPAPTIERFSAWQPHMRSGTIAQCAPALKNTSGVTTEEVVSWLPITSYLTS